MRPMKKCIIGLLISTIFIAKSAVGAEISGTVLSVPPANNSKVKGIAAFGPATGAVVKAMTSKGEMIAESKTGTKGVYSLNIPAERKDDVFLISANTSTGVLRSFFSENKTDVNPLTEILTRRILNSEVPPEYFTSDELKLILDRLNALSAPRDLSGMQTATGTIVYLLDQPEFNLALGDLTATYGMPGDNVAQVEIIRNKVNELIQGFNTNDNGLIRNSLAANAEIFIAGEVVNDTDKLVRKVSELHGSFKDIKLEAECVRVEIDTDKAEALTSEHIRMTPKGNEPLGVDETWIARNNLVFKNGKWMISKRDVTKCPVEKAAIETDGHISDWIGIRPCYYRKSEGDSDDSITAMYFARDDAFLYWRMDLNMEIHTPLSSTPNMKGIPRGAYFLYMLADSSNQDCNNFINFINNEITSAASGGRICIIGDGGKEDETYLTYDRFAIGSQSIEGSIPLEDMAFLSDSIYAFGTANRRIKPGMPAHPELSSGVVDLVFK